MKRANIKRAREITAELNILDGRLSVLNGGDIASCEYRILANHNFYLFEVDEGMRPVIIELIRQKLLKRHAELSAELETL